MKNVIKTIFFHVSNILDNQEEEEENEDEDDTKHLEFHDEDEQENERVPKPPKYKKKQKHRKEEDEEDANDDGDEIRKSRRRKQRKNKQKGRRLRHHHRKIDRFDNDNGNENSSKEDQTSLSNKEEEEEEEEESPDMSIHMLEKAKEGVDPIPQSFNNNAPVVEDSGNEMQHQDELNDGEGSVASIVKSKHKSKKLFGTSLAKLRLGSEASEVSSRGNTRFYVTQDGQRYQVNMKTVRPSTSTRGVNDKAGSFLHGGRQDFFKKRYKFDLNLLEAQKCTIF